MMELKGYKETEKRLSELGLDPNVWSVTFEDEDRIGLMKFGRKKTIFVVYSKLTGLVQGVTA